MCMEFGKPDIDLFATRLNCKVPRFSSWLPDPDAESIESFTISWEGENVYAFPPFCLIGRVVQKIIYEHARGILVVPDWATKSWFTMVKIITVQKPLTLLVTDDVLHLHSSMLTWGSRSRPLDRILRLLVCKVRGDTYY
jgi:hypothetical protein